MEKLFKKIIKIVKRADKIYYNKSFSEKEEFKKFETDVVTDKDIKTQDYLVNKFSKLIKNCGFVCEEKLNNASNNEYVFIIDPLDGTYNYKQQIKIYGTQVALQKNGKTIFSVLHLPAFKEIFYSYGGKSYLNGKQIFTSKQENARAVVLNISLSKRKAPFSSETLMDYLKTKKLRIFGSSLFDFSLVASGRVDCLITNSTTPWDVEPGLFLCVNAGAKVLNIKKHNLMIIASNNKVLNEIEKSLKLIDAEL